MLDLSRDPQAKEILKLEILRQAEGLELIASENYVSENVLRALGSVLTNKYAEGYPAKRYYGGCEYVDMAENLARERVKTLFNCDYVNVQPHSGSQANMAVYFSILSPGDKMMGLNLAHGGHLTHGSPVNFSGKMFEVIAYSVRKDSHLVDLDEVSALAKMNRPKAIVIGASAYSRDWDYKSFRQIADSIGAYLIADIAHTAGLIASKLLSDPMESCHFVTTTTHKTLRGPRGGMIMIGKDFENREGIKAPKSGRLRMMSEIVDSNVMPGIQGGPLMHVILAKAVAFGENLTDEFTQYSNQVISNSKTLAQKFIDGGYTVVSNGTDNHLMLLDLRNKSITGKQAEEALGLAGITVNKNMVPYDTQSPFVTSGIRIGSPAITTRGMRNSEMELIYEFIDKALSNVNNVNVLNQISEDVRKLCSQFPIYTDILSNLNS
ncbi:MAG: serine hydroxymethyltransferase [Ignavibacteria bacterium]|nr:serine hydroxymethyltransferase [Ignavibacteria bacterium]